MHRVLQPSTGNRGELFREHSLLGGTALDDITLRRNDEAYLDALGAERIPAPTTAGDFARRFGRSDVIALHEAVNTLRVKVWRKRLSRAERRLAVVDADGLVAPTTGECKEGMDMAYKGVWGYHPLLVSLSNTGEPLYLVNRPGNRPSHDGAAAWLDRAVGVVRQAFGPFPSPSRPAVFRNQPYGWGAFLGVGLAAPGARRPNDRARPRGR